MFGGTKSRAERHDWIMHNLDLVQMGHAKDKRPAEISGGMKQRVGLARALAMEPKVLLLDEPFGALDALTRAHLQDSVMAIHQKLGNTVLMITHDVDEAVLLSDRIVMMTNGPSARIGEMLDVPLARPRKRLELAGERDLPQVPPARARVPLRAPPLRRSGLSGRQSHDTGTSHAGAGQLRQGRADRRRRLPTLFYGRLFEIAPQVRTLFPDDMSEQTTQADGARSAVVVNGLDKLDTILPAASALAKQHVAYGVEAGSLPGRRRRAAVDAGEGARRRHGRRSSRRPGPRPTRRCPAS